MVVDGLWVGASTWVEVPLGSIRIDPTRFVDVAPVTRPSATNGAVARRGISESFGLHHDVIDEIAENRWTELQANPLKFVDKRSYTTDFVRRCSANKRKSHSY